MGLWTRIWKPRCASALQSEGYDRHEYIVPSLRSVVQALQPWLKTRLVRDHHNHHHHYYFVAVTGPTTDLFMHNGPSETYRRG